MSRIPPETRVKLAARLCLDAIEQHGFAADADAGFDGGEWSGPAHGDMLDREMGDIYARLQVRRDMVEGAVYLATYGDDPLGDWHGRNE